MSMNQEPCLEHKRGECSNNISKDYLKNLVSGRYQDASQEIVIAAVRALSQRVENGGEKYYCEKIMLQTLDNQQPNDVLEARLVSQATVLYEYAMKMLESAAGEYKPLFQVESLMNLGIKLCKAHNETIETLARYRRGGEQKVTVQHTVVADKAIVNNITEVGVPPENRGCTPCSESVAKPRPEPMVINYADNQPWQMEDVGCMEEKAPVRKQKKEKSAEIKHP